MEVETEKKMLRPITGKILEKIPAFRYYYLRIGLAEIITIAPLDGNAYFLISGFTISSKRLPNSALDCLKKLLIQLKY